MVDFSRIYRALGTPSASSNNSKNIPMLNVISSSLKNFLSSYDQLARKKALMNWFKLIPELNALVQKVAKDIISDYYFETSTAKNSGRNKILQANKFALESQMKSLLMSQCVDMLVTGEAFGWVGKLNDSQIKEAILRVVKSKMNISTKERDSLYNKLYLQFKEMNDVSNNNIIKDEVIAPKKYRYMASTTVEVVHDEYNVRTYVQDVAGIQKEFSPRDIIHFRPVIIDGKVNGFTPIESLVLQLELLRNMWENNMSLQRNGGVPDKIFVIKNARQGSPIYDNAVQQLEKYKQVENKHGNMVFGGDLDIHDLKTVDDMQFQNMGLYVTGLIAMQWEIPRSSIPYILGGTNTQDDTGGNSERGYWRNIKFFQDIIADTLNSQLFIPYFGVKIVFKNSHLQLHVQEQTYKQLLLNNIIATENILKSSGKQLNIDKKLGILGLNLEDIEDYEDPIGEDISNIKQVGMDSEDRPSNDDVNDSDSKKNIKNRKKREQDMSNTSKGMKPTGV